MLLLHFVFGGNASLVFLLSVPAIFNTFWPEKIFFSFCVSHSSWLLKKKLYPGLKNETRKNDAAGNSEQPMMRWTEELDLALLNALTKEDHRGNRKDGKWSTEAYGNIVQLLRTTIGGHLTKQHIKNRLKTLKENFGEAFDLFNSLSGFAWNPISRKFEAEEEVWDNFIKEKTHAKKWKRLCIKHYDILRDLFGEDRAKGKTTGTVREKNKRWEKEKEVIDLNDDFEDTNACESGLNHLDESPVEQPNFDAFNSTPNPSNQSNGASTSKGTKRKAHVTETMESLYEKVSMGINALAEAVRDGNYRFEKLQEVVESQVIVAERQVDIAERELNIMQQSRPHHFSESDVWNVLTELGIGIQHKMG